MSPNAGNHVSNSFKFQLFLEEHARPLQKGVLHKCTHGCNASIIQFHHLLNVDHISNTFSDDNSALHQEVTK